MSAETDFLVYRYEYVGDESGAGHELRLVGHLCVRHRPGEAVSKAMVRDAMVAAVERFPAGRYRLVPVKRLVDVTVESSVMIP